MLGVRSMLDGYRCCLRPGAGGQSSYQPWGGLRALSSIKFGQPVSIGPSFDSVVGGDHQSNPLDQLSALVHDGLPAGRIRVEPSQRHVAALSLAGFPIPRALWKQPCHMQTILTRRLFLLSNQPASQRAVRARGLLLLLFPDLDR